MSVKESTQTTLKTTLEAIRAPVMDDLAKLDILILKELSSDVPLIREITEHIVKSGGKRLRPLVVILFARALGFTGDTAHLELAAIIEFVHTATLLHDDVIDNSNMRRGQQTANALWGNQASVLIGDFLYSRSFQILTRQSLVPIMQVLANTTNAIAEGEVLQLMNCKDPDITEQTYFNVIERKTAKLFESACEIGAMLQDPTLTHHTAAASYGLHIGMAFQIIDDLLDYASDAKTIGKNIGDDLAEGKPTLPLIFTLQNSDEPTQRLIRNAITQADNSHIDQIIQAMHSVNAFEYCLAIAKSHINKAQKALNTIPSSPYHLALSSLLEFSLHRTF